MIINSNVVKGIYRFADNVTYTLGDYILYNLTIYEVLVPEVIGVYPTDPNSTQYQLLLNNNGVLINDMASFLSNTNISTPVASSLLKDIIYYYIGGLIGPNTIENYALNPTLDINAIKRNCVLRVGDNINSPMPFTDGILRVTGFGNGENVTINPTGLVYQEIYANTFLAVRSGDGVTWNPWDIKFDDILYRTQFKNYTNGIIDQIAQARVIIGNISNSEFKRVKQIQPTFVLGTTYYMDIVPAVGTFITLVYTQSGVQKSKSFIYMNGVIDSDLSVVSDQLVFVAGIVPLKLINHV